jgi:molybdopterin synthase catalytic subunit
VIVEIPALVPVLPAAFTLASEPIDAARLRAFLENRAAGACVTFEGIVRDHNDGRAVARLEYEAYPALALREGEAILREARERFALTGALCVHRTGPLEIGGMAVWVGVAAAHRGAAFDACRYVIDEVKKRVPIWKREFYADGTVEWVNCAACADPSHAHEAHGSPESELSGLPQGPGSVDDDLGA